MLIGPEILKQIEKIIDRAYTDFTYRLLGEDYLTDEQKIEVEALGLIVGRKPLIELLYLLARQRNTIGYQSDKTLQRLIDELSISGILPALSSARYTLEHAKLVVKEAIDNTKQELKKEVKKEILKVNEEYKQKQAITRITSVHEEEEKLNHYSGKLLTNIAKLATGAVALGLFRKELTSAMTNMINSTLVDNISEQALPIGQPSDPAQIVVYKEVVLDDRLSPECRRLHLHPDNSPRLYSLAELQANGTNIGRPKSQWKAVIGGTHPNCRCLLKLQK